MKNITLFLILAMCVSGCSTVYKKKTVIEGRGIKVGFSGSVSGEVVRLERTVIYDSCGCEDD